MTRKGHKATAETRARMSEAKRRQWADPEARAHMVAGTRKSWARRKARAHAAPRIIVAVLRALGFAR